MINVPKLTLFILISILYFATLFIKAENKIIVSVLYVIFILVGLYDLGKDDVEALEKTNE
jgi:hypothetical protein